MATFPSPHSAVSPQLRVKAAVVGGGPVGLVAALLLAELGLKTALVCADAPANVDRRTAALFTGSIELLSSLGVWADCAGVSAPLLGIRIIDDTGSLLRAPETLFRAEELGLAQFGFNVPNAVLVAALMAAAQQRPALSVIRGTANNIELGSSETDFVAGGFRIRAEIVIGADGRQSPVRTAAGIAARTWEYPQGAVVCSFTHQRPHNGISTEFHRSVGPLTTVPMPGNASSLVWVERRAEAKRLVGLADDAFREELATRLNGLLGDVEAVTPRGMFALSGLTAATLGVRRAALVGEAAHVMPPIGAQGLNLGLRDAAVLAEVLARGGKDLGAATVLDRYATSRAADVASRITAIDALNRSLLTEFLPVHLVRGLGLIALGAMPALRKIVVREGLQPSLASPAIMRPGGLKALRSEVARDPQAGVREP